MDPKFRRRSIEEYLGYVRFALDVGAHLIAFHPNKMDNRRLHNAEQEANAAFAWEALKEAEGSDLGFAYETFDLSLIEKIDDPRFGVLFDIGHATEQVKGDLTNGVIELMGKLFENIFQFHVHGVRVSDDGRTQVHLPMQANNGIDYIKLIRAIKTRRYRGLFVFEIGTKGDQDLSTNLADADYARRDILEIWSNAGL